MPSHMHIKLATVTGNKNRCLKQLQAYMNMHMLTQAHRGSHMHITCKQSSSHWGKKTTLIQI